MKQPLLELKVKSGKAYVSVTLTDPINDQSHKTLIDTFCQSANDFFAMKGIKFQLSVSEKS